MSTPAEMPKIRLVVAGSMPWESAHSGTIDCRVARAAEIPALRCRGSTGRGDARPAPTTDAVPPGAPRGVLDAASQIGQEGGQHRGGQHTPAANAYAAAMPRARRSPRRRTGPRRGRSGRCRPGSTCPGARTIGNASARYACRARLKTAPATVKNMVARANTVWARNAPSSATASRRQAPIRARLFTDPRRKRAGGQVAQQLAEPDQADQEGREADAGAEVARGQGDQRQDGARADRDQQRRPVDRNRHLPPAEGV